MKEKASLRERVLADVDTIPSAERLSLSRTIGERLLGLPELVEPSALMAFLSMSDELDLDDFLQGCLDAGHRVYSPKTLMKSRRMSPIRLTSMSSVKMGAYGIREPANDETAEPGELDFVVVPAVAYDPRGMRLGRGGGFYDRFMDLLSPEAVTCGVAFSRYLLDEVPTEPHDRAVDMIVTENEVIRIR